MTAQQFADETTKQHREQVHNSFIKDSQSVLPSLAEELEARRRETMDNQSESWRSGTRSESVGALSRREESTKSAESPKAANNSGEEASSTNTAAEEPAAEGTEGPPIKQPRIRHYVDQGTVLISRKANPTLKPISTSDSIDDETQLPLESPSDKPRTPSVLELLKAPAVHVTSPSNVETVVATSSAASMFLLGDTPSLLDNPNSILSKPVVPDDASVRLVCNDGSSHFALLRPGSSPIECTAVITDRYCTDTLRRHYYFF